MIALCRRWDHREQSRQSRHVLVLWSESAEKALIT
jgi:hypothetical protein